MYLENSTDFARIFFALLMLDAVPVPLKTEYRKTELEEIFANCHPSAVVTEKHAIDFLKEYVKSAAVVLRTQKGFVLHKEFDKAGESPRLDDWIASINYTYRGCGYPLGAMLPHDMYATGARVLQEGLQGKRDEKILVILPLSHIFTLVGGLFVPLLYGLTVVLLKSMHPRIVFETLVRYDIDYIIGVPELLIMLAKSKDRDTRIPSLKAFFSGGSLLPPDAYDTICGSFGVQLMHGYGLTEFAPVSRNIRGKTKPGTVGPVCRGVEVTLENMNRRGEGEALIKTPQMARGYLSRGHESAEALENGWLRSGDLMRWEGDHLVFVREIKNTCKVNGNMVDLAEVKKAVLLYPNTEKAEIQCCDGVLSAEITMKSSGSRRKDILEIKKYLQAVIAGYKVPKRIFLKS